MNVDGRNETPYYLYTFPHSFIPISGDQLVDNLNSGKYEYLRFINSMVPGIETEEMKKNNERIQIIFG